MPKLIRYGSFAALGLVMFVLMTYFASAYGLLGLFSKALCLMIFLSFAFGLLAKRK